MKPRENFADYVEEKMQELIKENQELEQIAEANKKISIKHQQKNIELESKLKLAVESLEALRADYSFANGQTYEDIDLALKKIRGAE